MLYTPSKYNICKYMVDPRQFFSSYSYFVIESPKNAIQLLAKMRGKSADRLAKLASCRKHYSVR
jgi:hypothetical protein